MTEVRTRFAPSPTGMLHIGGFRSALYAWLLARHHNGKFVLRIEDTDQERKVPGAIDYILEGFRWFGLDIDEGPTRDEIVAVDSEAGDVQDIGGPFGPYVQSFRLERYQEIADQLIASGHAFRCDCTPEMLQQEREEQKTNKVDVPGYGGRCRERNVPKDAQHVVRFRMPEGLSIEMQDGIRGNISWESVPLRDPVILKGDGFPTYHLAVVVDDHDMHISHAMRGEEWIPSAPLHLLIYKALDWSTPIFCHLPVVLGPDGKKLSKRHGATSWSAFRDEGYLPEAVLNFIARIGWSPGEGEDQEILSLDEMVSKFSLERVNASSGVFEYDKLNWMNGIYMRELSTERFSELVKPFLDAAEISIPSERWEAICPHIQERAKTLAEVPSLVEFLTEKKLEREMENMVTKKVSKEVVTKVLQRVKEVLPSVSPFGEDEVEAAVKPLAEELGVKAGAVLMPLRIAVTGKKATPPLYASLVALGRDETLMRLEDALAEVEALPE